MASTTAAATVVVRVRAVARAVDGHNGRVSAERLTGRLLVATPLIDEGVFHRSVILVLQHGDDGAQGVVLNKPLTAEVDAILPGWGDHVSEPATLFQGGPVQLDSALGLVATSATAVSSVQELWPGVGLVDLDAVPALVASQVEAVRVFVGYAGWSPGQLEGELRTGSWYAVDARREDTFTLDPDALWAQVLRRQPGALSWVALLPEDPSIN